MSKEENKYKIVVLSDMSDSATTALETTISLAKNMNAQIEVFHVKKPVDVIRTDNQLSATRTINTEFTKTKQKMDNLVSDLMENYNAVIHTSLVFGNIKSEIDNFIQTYNPDIIVIGKRKNKSIGILGDKITQHILKKRDKTIVIASNENKVSPKEKLSLGVVKDLTKNNTNEFVEEIIQNAESPLKTFRIVQSSQSLETASAEQTEDENSKEFKIKESKEMMIKLASQAAENDVNVLIVNRNQKELESASSLKKLVKKLNISLILAN